MRILSVRANNRKRVFEVRTRQGVLPFAYSVCDIPPTTNDRVARVFVDPELGREAFTFFLESGAEDSVHIDSVLQYNEDPAYMAKMTIYRLTVEASKRFERSPLSAREIARRLGTSPTQLYRLLDPTNYSKSLRQLFALLTVLGLDVDVRVRERQGTR